MTKLKTDKKENLSVRFSWSQKMSGSGAQYIEIKRETLTREGDYDSDPFVQIWGDDKTAQIIVEALNSKFQKEK